MRILVCGGRKFVPTEADIAILRDCLKDPATVVIHGDAPGADRWAGEVAKSLGLTVIAFPADWSKGTSAGPQRNQRMLDEGKPDIVLAFPGKFGTNDMIRKARKAGINVIKVPPPAN